MSKPSAPAPIQALIQSLCKLPGLGPRSAQRIAYHLLQNDRDNAFSLAVALSEALSNLKHCHECNNFSEHSVCELCADPNRDPSLLCVVEMPADLAMLEQTQTYKGLYYVMMGRISPLDGVGPKELKLSHFLTRVSNETVKEVILATNFTAEGEASAYTLSELIKGKGLKISRLSKGLPLGAELDLIDAGTVAHAMLERKPY